MKTKIKNESKLSFNFAFRSKIIIMILAIVLVSSIGITASLSLSGDVEINMPKDISDKIKDAGIGDIEHTGINCTDTLCQTVYFTNACEKTNKINDNSKCIETYDTWTPTITYQYCDNGQEQINCTILTKTNKELQIELQEQLDSIYKRISIRLDVNTDKEEKDNKDAVVRVEKGKGIIKEEKQEIKEVI